MRSWTLVPAGLAPIALIGGWTLAGARQPPGYDPVRDTISALAAHGAADPWIMTTGLAVLGTCHLATAAGLTDVGVAARTVLAVGGAATLVVAAAPQPNAAHVPGATVAFVALAVWPAVSTLPPRRAAVVTAAALVALLGWLVVALRTGAALGLSERALAGAQALCPLGYAFVLMMRRRGSASGR
jgi:hypothetical membrane protein